MALMAIAGISGQELLIVLFIILLIFGAKRLPEMARSMGKAKKEFQEGLKEADQEDEDKSKATPPQPAPPYAQPAPPVTPPPPPASEDKPSSAG